MYKAEESSKPSEETTTAEDKVAESSLFVEQKSLPSHQSFVKCHQRITLLCSWALLSGYSIFISLTCWLPSATPNKF